MDKKIKFFKDIQEELLRLFVSKNTDYGDDQINEFEDFGILIRSYDKINRLKNIYKKKVISVSEETIDDTWADLAVYCIMALMWRKGGFKK